MQKYLASVYYEVWTSEDAEIGETDNKGSEVVDEVSSLGDVLDMAERYNISARSKGDGTRWWSSDEPESDFRSGEDTFYSLQVTYLNGKPLSKADFDKINAFIEARESSSSVYETLANELAETYVPKMKKMLEAICQEAHRHGLGCSGVVDMSDDTHKWSITVYPKGRTMYQGADVSVEMSESSAYSDVEGGVNFSLSVVSYGGEILGGLTPFNYTKEVWVPLDDPKAVQERWQIFDQGVDPDSVIDVVRDFLASRKGNPGKPVSRSSAVRKIKNRVLK